jgi:hypothetical protein
MPEAYKLLASDHDGFTLRDRSEAILLLPDGDKYLQVFDPDGKHAVEIFISFKGDTGIRVTSIVALRGANALGVKRMRKIWGLLSQAYPNIETVTANRVTGARSKHTEVKWSLPGLVGRKRA